MRNFFKKMSNIGILESDSDEEKFRIQILNQIGGCGVLVMQIALLSDLQKLDVFQFCFDIFIVLLISIIVILGYYRKHLAARLYFTYFLSFIGMVIMMIFGSQMKFEFLFFLFAITSIVFFDKKSTIYFTFFYLLILFLIQKIFLYNHEYIIKFELSLFDHLTPFFSVFIVTFVILNSFKDQFVRKEIELLGLLSENETKNVKLQNANEELERFAHVASHDLKSPIRTVVSFLNLIERKIEKKEYDSVDEYIQFAKKGGQQMNQLVDDILQFSKFGTNEKIYIELVDLNEVLENVKQQLTSLATEKNTTIFFEKMPTLMVNKMLVSVLFQNLIENGIKYNQSSEPRIAILSKNTMTGHKISFTDNGIGIASEYHDKIFNLFTRLNSNENYQGSGMGLAICKKIVDKLNAKISIESETGKGSTFTVTFLQQNV